MSIFTRYFLLKINSFSYNISWLFFPSTPPSSYSPPHLSGSPPFLFLIKNHVSRREQPSTAKYREMKQKLSYHRGVSISVASWF